MDRSRAFYLDILGFKEADWGTNEFTSISRDGSSIYLCRGAQGNPGTWVWVGFDGDIFELHQQLKSKGVVIRRPPGQLFVGVRDANRRSGWTYPPFWH